MSDPLEDVSLREKKFIKTKVALMNAFIDRLQTTRMADVSIKDVCHSVEVSEGTFFNYFPRKIDLVYYCHQLFIYKVIYKTRHSVHSDRCLDLVDAFFQMVAEGFNQPSLVLEFISILTGEKEGMREIDIHPTEIAFALPECPGVEKEASEMRTLADFFTDTLRRAVQNKELPKKINIDDMCVHLVTVLVGVSVAVEVKGFPQLGRYYKEHLNLLWKAIGRV